ncbi:MAG: DUF805 domain-containing protein [Phenylobacterium sp.]
MEKLLKYLSFRGRANRQRFWLTALAIVGFYCVMLVLLVVARFAVILALAPLAGLVALVVASLANTARRLHDRNKSAWWLLLFQGVPMILSALGVLLGLSSRGDPDAAGPSGLLTLIELPILIWAFVELGCLRGSQGTNKFGEDPLQPHAAEVFA